MQYHKQKRSSKGSGIARSKNVGVELSNVVGIWQW